MGIISGIVKKGEDPVEGAKVYLLLDGAVVASAETNEDGEYACDDLDDNKKYHAVVEHSEVDGEEITHYSARSMPGIVPVPDPRLFLYRGDGYGIGVEDFNTNTSYGNNYWGIDDEMIEGYFQEDSGGASYGSVKTKDKVDLSRFNTLSIKYCEGSDDDSGDTLSVEGDSGPSEKSTRLPYADDLSIVSLDISDINGSYYVEIYIGGDYGDAHIEIYAIWLE